MNSFITRSILMLLILVTVIIHFTIWFLWQLDLNNYSSQLAAMVAMQTGWRIEFSGKIEHHFVPQGFWLLLKDVQIIDPRGQFVDIEWLKTKVSLHGLFDKNIVLENLEIAVRSCDVELRPEVPPPLPLALQVNATSLNLTATDCHVYDVESTVETFIKDINFYITPMPIVLDGWVVAGMPSGIIHAIQSGNVSVNSARIGDMIEMRQLKFKFFNDHGIISINNLVTELLPANLSKPSLISPLMKINTKIKLKFNETQQELFSTLWKGVDDVWLQPLSLDAETLNIITPIDTILIENLHINSDGLPLLAQQASMLSWLYNPPSINSDEKFYTTTIRGSILRYDNYSLNNYVVTTHIQPGRLIAELQQGIVNLIFVLPFINEDKIEDNLVHTINFNTNGQMKLNFENGDSNGLPMNSVLHQLRLTAQQIEFTQLNSSYTLDKSELKLNNLPLINNGNILPLNLHQAFTHIAPAKPTAHLSMNNLNHKNALAELLDLELAIDVDALSLQQMKLAIEDTQLTGNGRWKLSDPSLPWTIKFNSPGIAMEPLLNLLDVPSPLQGYVSVDLELNSLGTQLNELLSNLNGNLNMAGRDLKISNVDIDGILTHLETSRGIGLLDLGAYIMLGPAGILLTKGTQYSVLLGSVIAKGKSQVNAMNSTLKIKSGVVNTEDVALVTSKHRVVLAGTLDLTEQGLANLQIATVDAKGCAKYMETIGGSGRNPRVSGAGVVINSVLNPVNSVVGSIIGPVIGGCFVPFYSGEVPPPSRN